MGVSGGCIDAPVHLLKDPVSVDAFEHPACVKAEFLWKSKRAWIKASALFSVN